MSIDALNQICGGVAPSEGFAQHPVGIWPGTIVDIKQRVLDHGTPLWDLSIQTEAGNARFTIWGFSPEDIKKATMEQKARDQMLQSIARTKRIFVDLGIWDDDTAKSAVWSGGTNSILGALQFLKGKPCTINVQPSKKEAGKVVVYLNAPQSTEQEAESAISGHGYQPSHSAPQSSLDQVPF